MQQYLKLFFLLPCECVEIAQWGDQEPHQVRKKEELLLKYTIIKESGQLLH